LNEVVGLEESLNFGHLQLDVVQRSVNLVHGPRLLSVTVVRVIVDVVELFLWVRDVDWCGAIVLVILLILLLVVLILSFFALILVIVASVLLIVFLIFFLFISFIDRSVVSVVFLAFFIVVVDGDIISVVFFILFIVIDWDIASIIIIVIVRVSWICLLTVRLSLTEEVADTSFVVVSCVNGPACLP